MDDEPLFIEPVIALMEMSGIQKENIIYCQQIEQIFYALKQEKDIKCISLDMLFPDPKKIFREGGDINGVKALHMIRLENKDIKIVCYTILSQNEVDIKSAVERCDAQYIWKGASDGVQNLIDFFKKNCS